MDQITVSAAVIQVKKVTRFVNEHLTAAGCPDGIKIKLDIAVDEIFSNIAHYAYSREGGTVTVGIAVEEDPPCAVITFIDSGVPFNPLTEAPPDTTRLPKALRPIGGLGLFVVRKTMDDVSYVRRDNQNILTIRKVLRQRS